MTRARHSTNVQGAAAILCGLTLALSGFAQEPAPFRRGDELTGRSYSYPNRAFIHRETYRYRSQADWAWIRRPAGFRTTFGSVASKVFFVQAECRNVWEFTPWLDAEMRFLRAEDLDGRYERFLTGIGISPAGNWRLAALGDIVAEKENIDIHLESEWTAGDRHRLRLAAVAVDAMYLSKSFDGYYHKMPYTFFGSYLGRPWNRLELHLWANVNPDLDLEIYECDTRFRYRQTDVGMQGIVPLAAPWSLLFDGTATRSDRRWNSPEPTGENGSLARRFHRIGAEFRRESDDALSRWVGVRHVSLDESLSDTAPGSADVRNETILHGGVEIPLPRWNALFWPGLYASRVEKNVGSALDEEDKADAASGTNIVKLALPLEFAFAGGKTLTLNVTFVRDRQTGFGGGNIQGVIPF